MPRPVASEVLGSTYFAARTAAPVPPNTSRKVPRNSAPSRELSFMSASGGPRRVDRVHPGHSPWAVRARGLPGVSAARLESGSGGRRDGSLDGEIEAALEAGADARVCGESGAERLCGAGRVRVRDSRVQRQAYDQVDGPPRLERH